jgi:hypothetical protein
MEARMKRAEYAVPEAAPDVVKFKGGGKRVPLADRFWTKVDKSGGPNACWPWLAAKDADGYGLVGGDGRKTVRAHRHAYASVKGTIPKGKMVLHSCPDGDRRDCCNPDHMRPGTAKDNGADASVKGRLKRKLTDAQVLEIIRLRFDEKQSQKAIALRFGVAQNNISLICNGRTYGWLTGIGREEMKIAA